MKTLKEKTAALSLAALTTLSVSSVGAVPADTALGHVSKIVARDSGYSAVFIDQTIPAQGCTFEDRFIVDVSTDGGKSMMTLVITAMSTGLSVSIRVDGCSPTDIGSPHTSPRAIRVTLEKP